MALSSAMLWKCHSVLYERGVPWAMHRRYILCIDVVETGLLCCSTAVAQGSRAGFWRNVVAALVHWVSAWCVLTTVRQTRDPQQFSKEL